MRAEYDIVAQLRMLEAMAPANHATVERFVLECGRVHRPQPLPPRLKRRQPRLCFMNAAMLATQCRRRLTYVEGFALGYFPMHHAWCIDARGHVVDPTWDEPEKAEYLGVEIPVDILRRELLRLGHYGVLSTPRGIPNLGLMDTIRESRP